MKHTYAVLLLILTTATQAQVTHELQVEDDEFTPSSLTINAGDHVHITWDNSVANSHNLTQVEQSVWIANGDTPLPGGYAFGVGTANPGTDFTITPTADVWYVCTFHVSMGMKGTITVLGGNGIEEATAQNDYLLAPNPANGTVNVISPEARAVSLRLIDATGRTCVNTPAVRSIDTAGLVEGLYITEIRDQQGVLLSRQRLFVTR